MRLVLALVIGALALPVRAAEDPAAAPDQSAAEKLQRSLRAGKRTLPIKFDGVPDEPAWDAAEAAEGFTQRDPEEGKPATTATRIRILWDDEYLWIGGTCDDSEAPTARLSRRDRLIEGDSVAIELDTAFDRRTAYRFTVFAGGHIADGLHFNDTEFNPDWDTAWEAEVAKSERGWSFEARVPLRSLRIPEGARQFGFNAFRHLSRRAEDSQWRFFAKGTAGDVSLLGVLTGVEGIRPIPLLEFKPYIATRLARTWPPPADVSAPFDGGLCSSVGLAPQTVGTACLGLDLRYSLTSNLTLVATVNPDFGQVEVDALLLNLTTYEQFYPEKRPFFLEGMDLFQVPLAVGLGGPYGGNVFQLFYSRRIGQATTAPTLADGQLELHTPGARPVGLAAKVTGTVGPFDLGLLSSFEPRVFSQVLTADGAFGDVEAAAPVYSGALRLRLPAGEHFLAGASATAVDPLYTPGARHAHTGALDFTLFDHDRVWIVGGQAAGSLITGGARTTLVDGTVIDPSGKGSSGGAGSLLINRNGEYVLLMGAADYLSPGFDTNDLGYMQRANLLRGIAAAELTDPHPGSWWQVLDSFYWAREVRDAQGDLVLFRDVGGAWSVTTKQFWTPALTVLYIFPHVDDRELADGTPLERNAQAFAGLTLDSDKRRELILSANAGYQRGFDVPGTALTSGLRLLWRPQSALELSLDTSASYETGNIRMIRAATAQPGSGDPTLVLDPEQATQQAREYLLADLTARSISATVRGLFAFSPKLTLQTYAQLFTANLVYGAPQVALVGPGKSTVHYTDLMPARPEDQAPDADSGEVGLNLNLILRWEWRLGSTLYLVYSHSTAGTYTPPTHGFGTGFEGLSTANGALQGDTFMLKIDLLGAL